MQQRRPHTIFALPVVDRAAFVKTFRRLFGKAEAKAADGGSKAVSARTVYWAGSAVMAFGDDGGALITNDFRLLNQVLDSQRQNLAYFQSNYRQSTGFAELLVGRQRRADAWLRGAVRATAITDLAEAAGSPFALLAGVQFALGFDPEAARIDVRGNLPDVRSELIARVLKSQTTAILGIYPARQAAWNFVRQV